MRKLVVAAWVAASSLLFAVPASADGPVSLPPLAPGEVLLEVNAAGIVRSPATSATLTATIAVECPTEEEARRLLEEVTQRVTAAARTAGVAAADIDASPPEVSRTVGTDFYGDMNTIYTTDVVTNAYNPDASSAYGSRTVVIQVRNARGVPALRQALNDIENVSVANPVYRLDDDSAPRRTARAQAIQNARRDAESYAAATGMRIGRVLRVTERAGLDGLSMALSESSAIQRVMTGMEEANRDGQVETFAIIGVDYALVPAPR